MGTVVEIKVRSMRESWLSRKYMGVWRWASPQISRAKTEFPVMATTRMKRMMAMRKPGCLESEKRPRRMKSVMEDSFPCCMS